MRFLQHGTNIFVMWFILVVTRLIGKLNSSISNVVVAAAPPTNDECITALPILPGSGSIYLNFTEASVDSYVPDDCLDGSPPEYPGVWVNFTGTGGRLVARSCNNYYTYLSVFTGGCNPSTLRCVAATYNPCDRERFIFDTVQGEVYHILVQSYYDANVDLSIFAAPMMNDFCFNAKPILIGSGPVTMNTTYSTRDLEVTNDCLDGSPPEYPGVWVNFTGTGERLFARSCDSSYTYLSVFTGGCNPSTLTCVAATNSPCDRERFFFDTVQGEVYHVLVQSYYDATVNLSISAAPYGNDLCTNAQRFKLDSTIHQDTSLATTDDATIFNDCIDNSQQLFPGLWYNFTGTGERVVARSCEQNGVYISIFSGKCGRATLQCVAATTNPCEFDRFSFDTVKDTTYLAFIQSISAGKFDLTIFDIVHNDECINAEPVTFGVPAIGNVTFALADVDNVTDNCGGVTPLAEPGVWYSFQGTGGKVAVDPCGGLPISTRVIASVYKGNCGPATLSCVAVGSIECGKNELLVNTAVGTTYHLLVHVPTRNSFELLLFPFGPTPAPTRKPTNVSTTRQPTKAPTKQPTTAPTRKPCGLLGASIFCPLTFGGVFGHFIRRLFGGL